MFQLFHHLFSSPKRGVSHCTNPSKPNAKFLFVQTKVLQFVLVNHCFTYVEHVAMQHVFQNGCFTCATCQHVFCYNQFCRTTCEMQAKWICYLCYRCFKAKFYIINEAQVAMYICRSTLHRNHCPMSNCFTLRHIEWKHYKYLLPNFHFWSPSLFQFSTCCLFPFKPKTMFRALSISSS